MQELGVERDCLHMAEKTVYGVEKLASSVKDEMSMDLFSELAYHSYVTDTCEDNKSLCYLLSSKAMAATAVLHIKESIKKIATQCACN